MLSQVPPGFSRFLQVPQAGPSLPLLHRKQTVSPVITPPARALIGCVDVFTWLLRGSLKWRLKRAAAPSCSVTAERGGRPIRCVGGDGTATRQMFLRTCSSALFMFPPEPDMPMDVTIPLFLSKEEFVFSTPSTVQKSVRSSCLRFQDTTCINKTEPEDGAITNKDTKKKKRVTFADHKGLSLTKVKIFSKFTDPIKIPVNIQEMLSAKLTLSSTEEDKLVLDFTQPSSDYLLFRQNLEQNLVSLEHCMLKEKAFAGTVKVKNVSFEKSVMVRVTFDSWKSHTDVGCEYVKDTYPTSYSDTFSFEVSLPADMWPNEQVEFAVCYKVSGNEYWDSNQGKNYRIVWSYMKKNRHSDSSQFGIHFDRYGSPTCSHGLFPDWPSYAGYENIGPYY